MASATPAKSRSRRPSRRGWWARARFDTALRTAIVWLDDANQRNERFDDDRFFYAALRKRALATGRWLVDGDDCCEKWREAGDLSGEYLKTELPTPSPNVLADHLIDGILAGKPERAVAASLLAATDDDIAAKTALAMKEGAEARGLDRVAASAIAALCRSELENWLDNGAFRRVAAWAKAVWFDTGLVTTPEAALLTCRRPS